jgi:hypothetical protein
MDLYSPVQIIQTLKIFIVFAIADRSQAVRLNRKTSRDRAQKNFRSL